MYICSFHFLILAYYFPLIFLRMCSPGFYYAIARQKKPVGVDYFCDASVLSHGGIPSVVFGPRNYANVYTLMRQIRLGLYLPIGPGTNLKSMAYVENLIDATLYVWERTDLPALGGRHRPQGQQPLYFLRKGFTVERRPCRG